LPGELHSGEPEWATFVTTLLGSQERCQDKKVIGVEPDILVMPTKAKPHIIKKGTAVLIGRWFMDTCVEKPIPK
jgi:hypothetical protein